VQEQLVDGLHVRLVAKHGIGLWLHASSSLVKAVVRGFGDVDQPVASVHGAL